MSLQQPLKFEEYISSVTSPNDVEEITGCPGNKYIPINENNEFFALDNIPGSEFSICKYCSNGFNSSRLSKIDAPGKNYCCDIINIKGGHN